MLHVCEVTPNGQQHVRSRANISYHVHYLGCTKLRNEIETQRTKRNEILRNATKYSKMRNETQRNEIY